MHEILTSACKIDSLLKSADCFYVANPLVNTTKLGADTKRLSMELSFKKNEQYSFLKVQE